MILLVVFIVVLLVPSRVYAFDLGGTLTFLVPQVMPNTVEGYEYFNFFFGIPMAFAVIIIPIMILIMLVNRS